jgi:transposase
VENCNGLGRLLAQQLVGHGETVVDVPATLSARTRRLSGHSGRKTDEHDARSVAIAAAGNRRRRRVEPEDFSVVLGLLVDRRWHLVSHQHKTISPAACAVGRTPSRRRQAGSVDRPGSQAAGFAASGDRGGR